MSRVLTKHLLHFLSSDRQSSRFHLSVGLLEKKLRSLQCALSQKMVENKIFRMTCLTETFMVKQIIQPKHRNIWWLISIMPSNRLANTKTRQDSNPLCFRLFVWRDEWGKAPNIRVPHNTNHFSILKHYALTYCPENSLYW